MGRKYNFDYIVIGSGPAGSTTALILAKAKKHVAVVEGRAFGGANLNTRDIPYGVSLGFSHIFSNFMNYPEVRGQDFHFNFPTVVAHQDYVVNQLGGDQRKMFEEANITCIEGYAHFLDDHTVAVGDQQYTAEIFVLATGARLKTSEISGLDTVNYLTPDTAVKIRRLPKFAFVVGGGPTGCEIAEYYAELGAKVLIMERASRLLPLEDKEASETLTDYFVNELGMMVITGSKVVAVEQDGLTKRVIFSNGEQEKMVRVDCVVIATGSAPVVDMGLENAGVKYKKSGIIVNRFFQTSVKNIYALGDAIPGDSSTERSEYEAQVLATNLVNHAKSYVNYNGFIRRVSTYPEIATVGMNERALAKHDIKYKKALVELKDLPASKLERLDYGFVKLFADGSNHIVGATIVAPNASLMAEELSLAIRHRLSALEIASTPHIVNSYNHAIKLAAKQLIAGKKVTKHKMLPKKDGGAAKEVKESKIKGLSAKGLKVKGLKIGLKKEKGEAKK